MQRSADNNNNNNNIIEKSFNEIHSSHTYNDSVYSNSDFQYNSSNQQKQPPDNKKRIKYLSFSSSSLLQSWEIYWGKTNLSRRYSERTNE